jgi:CRP-like cAMP-binding protein
VRGHLNAAGSRSSDTLFLFPEREVIDHVALLEELTPDEKQQLCADIVKHHFQAGERLLAQGEKADSVQFIYSDVLQMSRQVQYGRTLAVRRLGPGDTYGEFSLLTGMESTVTLTALTSGLLLGTKAEDLKPILQARPELAESLSYVAARLQKILTTFDRSAVQQATIEPHDLLWRIKEFLSVKCRSRLEKDKEVA